MTKTPAYKHYPKRPKKLTATFAKAEYTKLLTLLPVAEANTSPKLWIQLFRAWNALEAYTSGETCRIGYAYSKDMSDKRLETAERYLREKISPVIDKPEHRLVQAFLSSKHSRAVAKEFGRQLVPVYETALKPLDPVNTSLNIKLGSLSNRYEKVLASAKINFDGKVLNLSEIRALQYSQDTIVRQKAFRASSEWLIKNRAKLAKIYNEQVKLRTQAGKNLGYKGYIPLAYQIRGRQNYGESDVTAFRNSVLKNLVPLYKKIARDQARRMGQPTLKPWDVYYDPLRSIPLGTALIDKQLANAQVVFDKLSPVLGKHFKYMRDHGLIDLETRPNKQAGAYCTIFQDEDKVAILCNSTGDPDDVRVLTHEMGHAFQFWESQHIKAVDLQVGTAELAEVYSMGMEFLSLPHMNEFFSKENAKKYAEYKWIDSIFTICYVCVVDEFQHWVYKNPDASLERRDKSWAKLYAKYLPFVDFSGSEKYLSVRWYAQRHIFAAPFYYIDYALAETSAMQLGLLAAKDHANTMKKYLKMCRIGGTKGFLEALDYADLKSPFDEDLIISIAKEAEKILL